MKKLIALLLLTAACDPAPAPSAPPAPPAPGSDKPLLNPEHPEMKKQAPATFTARFNTSKGDFVIRVTRDWAPLGADRFYNLVRNGFYDGCRFFRVLENFMAQTGINGDPQVSAAWRNSKLMDDPRKESNLRGYVSFAKTGAPNSRGTQIFINFKDNSGSLDPQGFAPFGKVIGGLEVLDTLYREYGEGPPHGSGPNQGQIEQQGNGYLMAQYPKLDFITSATVGE